MDGGVEGGDEEEDAEEYIMGQRKGGAELECTAFGRLACPVPTPLARPDPASCPCPHAPTAHTHHAGEHAGRVAGV